MKASLADLRSGRCAGATRIDLPAGLTEFPRELFDLAESLEILELSGNRLTALPDDLPRLRKLRVLFCTGNAFSAIPEVLGTMPVLEQISFRGNGVQDFPESAVPPALRWLILTGNHLRRLPSALGRTPLRKCALAGNRLEDLPEAMSGCRDLELLRLAVNDLQSLPSWLAHVPRLAWLGFADTPASGAFPAADLPRMPWTDVRLGAVLGDGASGVVHAAESPAGPIACKLFKGGLTSDGSPLTELAAAGVAGDHPHLVGVDGIITGHPDGRSIARMPLVQHGWQRLAAPPSLTSCTRDVYDDTLRFTPVQARAIARSIVSAVAHLHRQGVLHGDVYAHNILWRADGHARLGDFGAASPGKYPHLHAVEMRAVGCLLEELAQRTTDEAAMVLDQCARRCLDERPAARPAAAELLGVL